MQLLTIHAMRADGTRGESPEEHLDPVSGILGGVPAKNPDRQISLLAGELLPGLRSLGGLCTGKFDADFITEGLDYASLTPGDTLEIGGAAIRITAQGKRCFDECPIRGRGECCPLPANCAFARVIRAGRVAAGDAITFHRRAAQ